MQSCKSMNRTRNVLLHPRDEELYLHKFTIF